MDVHIPCMAGTWGSVVTFRSLLSPHIVGPWDQIQVVKVATTDNPLITLAGQYCYFFLVLGIDPMGPCLLSKQSATEPYPALLIFDQKSIYLC